MCAREDTLTHNLGVLYIDDAMSYNSLTTQVLYNWYLVRLRDTVQEVVPWIPIW